VEFLSTQPVGGTEAIDRGQHLVLHTLPALEVRVSAAKIKQDLADQGAQGCAVFGCPNPSATVDIVRK
jgi:hypothetical protein